MLDVSQVEIGMIEELAANAVPPAISQELDGWRLRFNFGFTRRANSVLASRSGNRLTLDQRMAQVEDFYGRRGLSARFQVNRSSQPDDLDAYLEARGYTVDSAITSVQVAAITALLPYGRGDAEVREQPDPAWLAAYWASEGIGEPLKQQAQQQMLARIGPPAGFATMLIDGEIAALALGVVERGWLGIFSVATVPAYRRRGLGIQTLGDLAVWAQGYGAAHCYLQVMHANTPAVAMYRRLGFVPHYDYWYRMKG